MEINISSTFLFLLTDSEIKTRIFIENTVIIIKQWDYSIFSNYCKRIKQHGSTSKLQEPKSLQLEARLFTLFPVEGIIRRAGQRPWPFLGTKLRRPWGLLGISICDFRMNQNGGLIFKGS